MVRLDTGAPTWWWGTQWGCTVPMLLVLNLALLGVSVALDAPLGIFVLFGLFLLAFNGLIAAVMAVRFSEAYWVDGRVLVRRTPFGRVHHDLSTTNVRAESVAPNLGGRGPLPRIIVEPPNGRPARVWIRNPMRQGALLPPDQLTALAWAIDPTGTHPVAVSLRAMAADPFGRTF